MKKRKAERRGEKEKGRIKGKEQNSKKSIESKKDKNRGRRTTR